jgi:hypothetical protein
MRVQDGRLLTVNILKPSHPTAPIGNLERKNRNRGNTNGNSKVPKAKLGARQPDNISVHSFLDPSIAV